MARYYRRRYTRVVKPKKKWATNIRDLSTHKMNQQDSKNFTRAVLVENSTLSPIVTPTPTILKAGNFKVQADVSYTTAAAAHVDVMAYVLFLPEGMDPDSYIAYRTVISNHPEWIMAWKYASNDFVGAATTNGTQTFSFSSRLKRNLNSGDRIVFVCLFMALDSNDDGVNITGLVVGGQAQYWTCAN